MNTLHSCFKKITVVPLICQDCLKPKVGCHEIKWKMEKVISWFERLFSCLAKGCMLLMKMKLFSISGSGQFCGKQNCRSLK